MSAVAKLEDRVVEVASGVSSHWVALPNEKLYRYVTAGDPSKPTLVLLHGFTDSWRSFDAILPLLQENFHLIAFNQRGHGDTGSDFRNFEIEDFVVDAISFVGQLTNLPVHLLGHSLGSIIAQRVAAAQPELVDRLILIGATDTAAGNPALAELHAALTELTEAVPPGFAHEFQSSTVYSGLDSEQLGRYVAESQRVPLNVWRAVARSLGADDKVVTPEISAETLIL